jgi:hypothetical protein
MQEQDEAALELSPEALAALASFATERGLDVDVTASGRELRQQVVAILL